MTGVYADTSSISDTNQIDAADVKPAIDALDTQVAKLRFAGGRLTLSSSQAVPTSDISSGATLYYLPFDGAAGSGLISLWDASAGSSGGIKTIDFTGATVSMAISSLTQNNLNDIFGYLSGGVLTLESVAWTSGTPGSSSRATSLTWQNGMLCKDGDPTRRFLGTVFNVSGTTTTDTERLRYVSNAMNAVPRQLARSDTTASWTYATSTWRYSNNASNNAVNFIAPLDGTYAQASFMQALGGTSITASIGLALDSTTPTIIAIRDGTGIQTITTLYNGAHSAGRHYIASCEIVSASTATFYGNAESHAIRGFVMA